MKRLSIILFSCLFLFISSALAAGTVYAPKNARLYEVGKNIEPGVYSLEFKENESLKLAVITVGNDLQYSSGRDAVLIKNGQFSEYKIDKDSPSLILNLVEGNKLFVNAGSPRLVPAKDTAPVASAASTPVQKKPSTDEVNQKKLSSDEVKKMVNSAPYVSSKSVVIDSPDGVDFYTYFGSGIIMSGTSGDCFKMVDCDDEPIVDHYKLIPVKAGKGKIEYSINMKKKIVVNVTVKEAALDPAEPKVPISPEDATSARAIKAVNIRADISTKSQKMGELKKGDSVEVIKAFYTDDFHQILYKGKTCYVAAQFVELE